MGMVKSCCQKQLDDKLMVAKMDLSHCGCIEVPHIVFNAERYIETLILASNQISTLPPQLFHCQELKHLNLNDNCLSSIPPAIGSFTNLISLKLDKNNLQELPENFKLCKKLKRLSLSNNPWKQLPNIVTQLISLEELHLNDCELHYLPASVGRLSKLKIIELRNNSLCNLPLSMTRLESLTRLDISDNEFSKFPNCICKLKSLTELLIDNNDIEEITDIKNLVHLEHLDASYNHITIVSETIGCCVYINLLNLSFNYIEQLPSSIGNITYLQTLQLEMNELTEIPKSIGKLSHLEELNVCNNKLYSLPSTIGLLRNLRSLNVSRNMIEEFPSEIGSCTKLSIINAAYNRLQVLPSEVGYLNNLKVLDLVGNFLMYLPITIVNLRGIRAIWLSANQNVPLIPFTEDLNIASGERFLTNIALPQLGELPLHHSEVADKKVVNNEKSLSWNKKIRFADDEDILPGKLHRTPTPFPKELRSPNKKHQRVEETKPNDNYVNVIDGVLSEQEAPLLKPPDPVTKNGVGLLNLSEGCVGRIREANIRRSSKNSCTDMSLQNFYGENCLVYIESEHNQEREAHSLNNDFIQETETQSKPTDDVALQSGTNFEYSRIELNHARSCQNESLSLYEETREKETCDNQKENFISALNSTRQSSMNNQSQQVLYSNLIDNDKKIYNAHQDQTEENLRIDSSKGDSFHNNEVYESAKNFTVPANNTSHSSTYEHNGNVDNAPKPPVSASDFLDHNFTQSFPNSSNQEPHEKVYTVPQPLPPPSNSSTDKNSHSKNFTGNISLDFEKSSSKQDFIFLAEQMKIRNISPPCYEIAKMYSTKAALFENNRIDQLTSN